LTRCGAVNWAALVDTAKPKIVKLVGSRQERAEVVLQSSNFLICQATFEKALFVWSLTNRCRRARWGTRGLGRREAGRRRRRRACHAMSRL
jgi:hypothetical protein